MQSGAARSCLLPQYYHLLVGFHHGYGTRLLALRERVAEELTFYGMYYETLPKMRRPTLHYSCRLTDIWNVLQQARTTRSGRNSVLWHQHFNHIITPKLTNRMLHYEEISRRQCECWRVRSCRFNVPQHLSHFALEHGVDQRPISACYAADMHTIASRFR